jgi:hypothetical protein
MCTSEDVITVVRILSGTVCLGKNGEMTLYSLDEDDTANAWIAFCALPKTLMPERKIS